MLSLYLPAEQFCFITNIISLSFRDFARIVIHNKGSFQMPSQRVKNNRQVEIFALLNVHVFHKLKPIFVTVEQASVVCLSFPLPTDVLAGFAFTIASTYVNRPGSKADFVSNIHDKHLIVVLFCNNCFSIEWIFVLVIFSKRCIGCYE